MDIKTVEMNQKKIVQMDRKRKIVQMDKNSSNEQENPVSH